jgi:hypothetical protein
MWRIESYRAIVEKDLTATPKRSTPQLAPFRVGHASTHEAQVATLQPFCGLHGRQHGATCTDELLRKDTKRHC